MATSANERGIALVLALFLMSAMSVLATSMMFLSQTETYASMNYRMMSQARYAGEAAVQKAASLGATLEGSITTHKWGRLALMADPFGNGYCFVQFLGRGYDEIAE